METNLKTCKDDDRTDFLPVIFLRGTIVMKISFVMLIFLLFSDQILGGKVSEGSPPVEKSQRMDECLCYGSHENHNFRRNSQSVLKKGGFQSQVHV